MNIAMFTNAYEPVIGGLERSIATFTEDVRAAGHKVLIVTLAFPGAETSEPDIFRLPAVKEVGGTAFSMKVPVPAGLKERLDAFGPDIVHSHHPFMMGDTALRVARRRGCPLVFTHHTLYERYAYLFSRESHALELIAEAIATQYANLCDLVIAPTNSIKRLIHSRGVTVPTDIVPTGIDIDMYAHGDGQRFRHTNDIPSEAFVLGYLGRVVEAKNMAFLARVAGQVLADDPDVWFLIVGDGDARDTVYAQLQQAGVGERVVMTGSLEGPAVADAYAAMDLFAFASKTETQGIVLIEGLCAGVPIVALDAPGARDILEHDRSGIILDGQATSADMAAQIHALKQSPERISRLSKEARARAQTYDRRHCAELLLEAYSRLHHARQQSTDTEAELWAGIQNRFGAEWDLFMEKCAVISSALKDS